MKGDSTITINLLYAYNSGGQRNVVDLKRSWEQESLIDVTDVLQKLGSSKKAFDRLVTETKTRVLDGVGLPRVKKILAPALLERCREDFSTKHSKQVPTTILQLFQSRQGQIAKGILVMEEATNTLLGKPLRKEEDRAEAIASITRQILSMETSDLVNSFPSLSESDVMYTWVIFRQRIPTNRLSFYALGGSTKHLWNVLACCHDYSAAYCEAFYWTMSLITWQNLTPKPGTLVSSAFVKVINTLLDDATVQKHARTVVLGALKQAHDLAQTDAVRAEITRNTNTAEKTLEARNLDEKQRCMTLTWLLQTSVNIAKKTYAETKQFEEAITSAYFESKGENVPAQGPDVVEERRKSLRGKEPTVKIPVQSGDLPQSPNVPAQVEQSGSEQRGPIPPQKPHVEQQPEDVGTRSEVSVREHDVLGEDDEGEDAPEQRSPPVALPKGVDDVNMNDPAIFGIRSPLPPKPPATAVSTLISNVPGISPKRDVAAVPAIAVGAAAGLTTLSTGPAEGISPLLQNVPASGTWQGYPSPSASPMVSPISPPAPPQENISTPQQTPFPGSRGAAPTRLSGPLPTPPLPPPGQPVSGQPSSPPGKGFALPRGPSSPPPSALISSSAMTPRTPSAIKKPFALPNLLASGQQQQQQPQSPPLPPSSHTPVRQTPAPTTSKHAIYVSPHPQPSPNPTSEEQQVASLERVATYKKKQQQASSTIRTQPLRVTLVDASSSTTTSTGQGVSDPAKQDISEAPSAASSGAAITAHTNRPSDPKAAEEASQATPLRSTKAVEPNVPATAPTKPPEAPGFGVSASDFARSPGATPSTGGQGGEDAESPKSTAQASGIEHLSPPVGESGVFALGDADESFVPAMGAESSVATELQYSGLRVEDTEYLHRPLKTIEEELTKKCAVLAQTVGTVQGLQKRNATFTAAVRAFRIPLESAASVVEGNEPETREIGSWIGRLLANGEYVYPGLITEVKAGTTLACCVLSDYARPTNVCFPMVLVIDPATGVTTTFKSRQGLATVLAGDVVGSTVYVFGIANFAPARASLCLPCIDIFDIKRTGASSGFLLHRARINFPVTPYVAYKEVAPFKAVGHQHLSVCKAVGDRLYCWSPRFPASVLMIRTANGERPICSVIPVTSPSPAAVCFTRTACYMATVDCNSVKVSKRPYYGITDGTWTDFPDVGEQGTLTVRLEPWTSYDAVLATVCSSSVSWCRLIKDAPGESNYGITFAPITTMASPEAAGCSLVKLSEWEDLEATIKVQGEMAVASVQAPSYFATDAQPFAMVSFHANNVVKGTCVSTSDGLQYTLNEKLAGCADRVHFSSHGMLSILTMTQIFRDVGVTPYRSAVAVSVLSPKSYGKRGFHIHASSTQVDHVVSVVSTFPRVVMDFHPLQSSIRGSFTVNESRGQQVEDVDPVGVYEEETYEAFNAITGLTVLTTKSSHSRGPRAVQSVHNHGLRLNVHTMPTLSEYRTMTSNPPKDQFLHVSPIGQDCTDDDSCLLRPWPSATSFLAIWMEISKKPDTKVGKEPGSVQWIAKVVDDPTPEYASALRLDKDSVPADSPIRKTAVGSDTSKCNCYFWVSSLHPTIEEGNPTFLLALIASKTIDDQAVGFVLEGTENAWSNDGVLVIDASRKSG